MQVFNFIFSKFKARKVFWMTFLVVPALFFVDPIWFLISFLLFRVWESIYIATYHEFQVHKMLKPRHWIFEFLGYYLIAAGDVQRPIDKIKHHWKHHEFYQDFDKDPTQARVELVKWPWLYCLDLGAHAPHYHIEDKDIPVIQTPLFQFFNKYATQIFFTNMIVWCLLFGVWSFITFFVFPVWAWGIVFRSIDWYTHKLDLPDSNWLVFVYGSQCWHQYHHNYDRTQTEPYYGEGIWKLLNIDFYVQKLTFKPID